VLSGAIRLQTLGNEANIIVAFPRTTKYVTLNGHSTLNSVFAQVRLEFLHGFFENTSVKNKGGPILCESAVNQTLS